MKKTVLCFALASLLALGGSAVAEIGTIDDVPAATLLLPYFEVDLADTNGITTLFSVNNASAAAQVAHVTLWTDMSIPTLDFDVYLTGYDVQTFNVRDIFDGRLPRTADATADPTDTISPNPGPATNPPIDINFPGNSGPCAAPYSDPALGPNISGTLIDHIRAAHTGGPSPVVFNNRCSGADYGDEIARGYITVDVVTTCNLSFPSDAGYFTLFADYSNVLWGDYFYVNPGQNFAQGETLVHIEACEPGNGYIGFIGTGTSGVNTCPFDSPFVDYTFYGRYAAVAGNDNREALSTTFASRYLNGGAFTGGTDLIVWRDSKTVPVGGNGPFSCAVGGTDWFPLNQADAVAFDEQENSTDLCFRGDNVSPPIGGADVCFPLEAQRIDTQGGNVIASDLQIPYTFGWLFLNLNTSTAAVGGIYDPTAQAWVTTIMDADGRFSVGFDAIQLDQANQTYQSVAPGGVLLEP